MELIFYSSKCSTTNPDSSAELVADEVNGMSLAYDTDSGILSYVPTRTYYMNLIIYAILSDGEKSTIKHHIGFSPTAGATVEQQLTEEQMLSVTGFEVQISDSSGYWYYAVASLSAEIAGTFIYPTGTIDYKALPVTLVGFSGAGESTGVSHIQIIVAEILDNENVGGSGHVWESSFYPIDADYQTTLDEIMPMCEGQELTNFNVSFHFVQENEEGSYDFVKAHIVGDATTVTTFSVADEVIEQVEIDVDADSNAYILSPVLVKVNRHDISDAQHVRVEAGSYIADFEFYPDRNILEMDIAEYLQTLFVNVDLFEYQAKTACVGVKIYDADWNHLQTTWLNINCIYGKRPDPELPECQLRVQWLDKYGYLHDEYFKIVENVTEGESKQKYVSNREDREDKTGEKSVTLAYVGANSDQKEQLKTIVFADHVRAYIGDAWKRVKIANTYKTGKGRVTANFEFTIKYAL